MEWKEYTGNRLISQHPDGFYVIRPKEPLQGQPVFCPLCEAIMKNYYDDEAYRKHQCCDACSTTWACPDEERWKTGWRPDPEQILKIRSKTPI